MLIKASTDEARHAELALIPRPAPSSGAGAANAPPLRSAQELEIEALQRTNAELERRVAALQHEQAQAIALAERKARDEAARQHVRDDEHRLAELGKALVAARSDFDRRLEADCAELARAIAASAFNRLAGLRAEDDDWIARMVSRRLGEIGANAVVALRVRADEFAGDALDQLRGALPAGLHIVPDPEIARGTAKIELRLGEVVIEPGRAIADLAHLIAGDGTDG